MKELRIPSIVLSTKETKETKEDAFLLIGEAKYKLVFEDSRGIFGYKTPKHVIE